ncbi:chromate transporter [Caulobacter sp. S45]|uniref:chromate transporter n=1 Tax=Caulobacter sp. S45 TaxID=1641861 RepID=UPI001C202333|nr:chromate transporter [Caulobacter sp. S45]
MADVFVRYGNITLGGGSATITVLRREILERRRWIGEDDFTVCFALARLTPGTNLLAFCTGIGWITRGLPGAIVALLAGSIPCATMVVLATALFSLWQHVGWAQAAIHGAVAGAVAVTVKTCWTIAHPYVRPGARLRVAVIAGAAFLLNVLVGLSPIEVLLLAVAVGIFLPTARA